MLNHIDIMGRLTKDPELRYTQNSIPVCSFTIACERDFSGKDSAEKDVDFIDVVAWRHTAEFVTKYFTKGRMAVVSGQLQTRTWTDNEGKKRKITEIKAENVYFGDSKKESSPGGYQSNPTNYAPPQENNTYSNYSLSDMNYGEDDEDLPF